VVNSDQEKTCLWAQEVIDAYVDGELSAADTFRLESHLSACPVCAEELQLARRVKHTLRILPPQYCPDRVVAAALEEAESERAVTRKPRWQARFASWHQWQWRLAAAVAMALAIAVTITVFIRPQQPPTTMSPEELARAERQVKWTLAYVGHVSQSSASIVYEEVIESELEPLVKKGLSQIQQTKAKLFRNPKS
jgi:anti-sigma factor RsiW